MNEERIHQVPIGKQEWKEQRSIKVSWHLRYVLFTRYDYRKYSTDLQVNKIICRKFAINDDFNSKYNQ